MVMPALNSVKLMYTVATLYIIKEAYRLQQFKDTHFYLHDICHCFVVCMYHE